VPKSDKKVRCGRGTARYLCIS